MAEGLQVESPRQNEAVKALGRNHISSMLKAWANSDTTEVSMTCLSSGVGGSV
jgi:hypothetical protein